MRKHEEQGQSKQSKTGHVEPADKTHAADTVKLRHPGPSNREINKHDKQQITQNHHHTPFLVKHTDTLPCDNVRRDISLWTHSVHCEF